MMLQASDEMWAAVSPCRAAVSHRANLTRPVAPQAVKANLNNGRLREKKFKLYDLPSEVFMDDTAHGVRLANDKVRSPAPNLATMKTLVILVTATMIAVTVGGSGSPHLDPRAIANACARHPPRLVPRASTPPEATSKKKDSNAALGEANVRGMERLADGMMLAGKSNLDGFRELGLQIAVASGQYDAQREAFIQDLNKHINGLPSGTYVALSRYAHQKPLPDLVASFVTTPEDATVLRGEMISLMIEEIKNAAAPQPPECQYAPNFPLPLMPGQGWTDRQTHL